MNVLIAGEWPNLDPTHQTALEWIVIPLISHHKLPIRREAHRDIGILHSQYQNSYASVTMSPLSQVMAQVEVRK
jgi:hypothetical protein